MPSTLGQILRETREALNLSLAEVSFQTKIREHYLQALENNNFSELPSAVQGKGFLKNYASFLKLSEKKVMEAWFHPEHFFIDDLDYSSDTIPEIITEEIEEKGNSEFEQTNETEDPIVIIHEFTDNDGSVEKTTEEPEIAIKASQKIFNAVGTQLKKQRELLNLSLDDIERFTNIRAYYLNALEKGAFDQLPSIVQGRGMLSNYSNFLNMDSEAILLQYAEGLQTKRNEQYDPRRLDSRYAQNLKTPDVTSPNWRRFISADLMIVSTLIISLFIFILWGAANVAKNNTSQTTSSAPPLSEILLEEPIQVTPSLQSNIAVTPTQSILDVNDTEAIIESEDLETTSQAGSFPINISIVANQRAYLKIISDNKIVFDGRVIPGNAYEFSGSTLIEMITGNAAALDIYFNQQQIGPIGEIGEVKYLIFSPDQSILTPTAQFTFTPTLTIVPSSTPRSTITPTSTPMAPSATVTPYIP